MKEVPQTFDGISKKFLKMISQFKSPRIDIVFDQYFTPSIKDCERLRRNETTRTVSIGPNQIRHHNFAGELKNTQFKEALVKFFIDYWANDNMYPFIASGWIVNDDKYDFVWFTGEQFPSSAADIVIKKPTLLENQNTKQDDDYDDIDNNGSSDNNDDYEDASVFCDTFTE
ncbi:uncharacterized protein TNCV_2392041 [Trichonephila clavipes]|nr:uncharacterized protein TNCV_2392041 [Trichonephila clavipes]